MQDFDHDWNSSKQPVTFEPEKGRTEITVSCAKPVELRGVREDGSSVLLHSGTSFRLVATFRSYPSVVLRSQANTEFGYRVRHDPRQDGEPLNHDNPPAPPLPGNDNMLLQVKRIIQDEMRRNRPPVLDPEDLPFSNRYMVDEDDERFEEELYASPANPVPSGPESPQERDEPAPEAAEPQTAEGAPEPLQHAAE